MEWTITQKFLRVSHSSIGSSNNFLLTSYKVNFWRPPVILTVCLDYFKDFSIYAFIHYVRFAFDLRFRLHKSFGAARAGREKESDGIPYRHYLNGQLETMPPPFFSSNHRRYTL